jgi:hypothetical protein
MTTLKIHPTVKAAFEKLNFAKTKDVNLAAEMIKMYEFVLNMEVHGLGKSINEASDIAFKSAIEVCEAFIKAAKLTAAAEK